MEARSAVRHSYCSSQNIFGLSRTYTGTMGPPNHDPEDFVSLDDVSGAEDGLFLPQRSPISEVSNDRKPSFYPYPNRSTFLLGDWYWCGGVQKSQQSFQNLVGIIGDPEFRPEDIGSARWDKINAALVDDSLDNNEWEDDTAGWKKTPVTINVPFPAKSVNPGPKDYTLDHFYHRSLVSVIREKLSNSTDDQHFHYEPYELRWKPADHSALDGRVQGELYTSPEFEQVHQTLQDTPGEPGCGLPRVVVALMFWSDSTHLTSFGKSYLWPLYMGFGNESKYRRCKPSLHLLNHVAYFEKVEVLIQIFIAKLMLYYDL